MVQDRTDTSVRIFDTTLRDGEQSPGASLTCDEKLVLARLIAGLGVDVIEAGFPAASPDDLVAVEGIAREVGGDGGPIVAALARTCPEDIEKGVAGRAAGPQTSHPYVSRHIRPAPEAKLGMSRDQVIDRAGEMVSYARELCDDVEFSPRRRRTFMPRFLIQVLATVHRGRRDDSQYPRHRGLRPAAGIWRADLAADP